MSYLDDLSGELARRGVRGRTRARILAEVDDHLHSDPDARDRFGEPAEIANAFAAELGTYAARRAAVGVFAALAIAGAVYAVAFVSLGHASPPTETLEPALGAVALALLVVAPQVAFVAGSLAVARVWRRRGRLLPSRELTIVRRRTGVGAAAGIATMGALALYAYEFRPALAGWWSTSALAATAAAAALLALSGASVVRAARLQPALAGDAGDVFDDLGFTPFGGDPWRLARYVAVLCGLAVWLAGAAQGDPIDGLIRGVLEGLACFGGFVALGRYLGLR